jgi:diaminohydroxyphosphoribosylaminopyrimidine deaminase/5-amino-6-(5-phosphoribosylamino)uracil reductase
VNIHEKYIKRCIQLAKNGVGLTYPNPMVGSVIVLNNKVIGEGWHKKAGKPHAEVNAINSVTDKSLLKEATIYVSLEPCSHFGKTPPCAHLIIQKKIKKVVVGCLDPNEKVAGRGIKILQEAGCEVTFGVLEEECKELNKRFFTYHIKKRPYITLKWAETKDGFIDRIRDTNFEKRPNWISNSYSQQLAHKLRASEQGILVGTNTVINDNPALSTRSWYGANPIRVVLDKKSKLTNEYKIINDGLKTIVFTENKSTNDYFGNVIYEKIDFKKNLLKQVCDILYKYEVQALIVEGGKQVLESFIRENLWDEAYVFVGETVFKEGLKAPKLKKVPIETRKISTDTLKIYKN